MDQRRRNSILAVLFIGVLMGALDIAIVGPAIPAIRGQFDLSDRTLPWLFGIYVLFNLIGTPLMARMSDHYGRRGIYVLDVALFAIGSLVVSLSHDFGLVLVGRAIQGFGAGGIFPVASAVIGDTFPPEKRGGALGLIGAVFGLAFLVGPILGVVILSLATWHWLFLVNLPIALVVIIASLRVLPAGRPATRRTFDWKGTLVLAATLAALSWGINHLDTANFVASLADPNVLPALLGFVLGIFLLVAVERNVSDPIIPLDLFDRKQLRLTYILAGGAGIGEASLVFMPLLAVVALEPYGITKEKSSYLLLPVVLAMAVGSPLAGRMLDRFGSRLVILVGTSVMTAGMVLLGLFSANIILFITAGALIGFGMSALLGAPMRYIMLNEAHPSERSVAQGVLAVFTSAGQLLGSALTGAIAASRAVSAGDAAGYSLSFMVIGGIGLLLVLIALMLKDRAAERMTVQQHEAMRQSQEVGQSSSGAVLKP